MINMQPHLIILFGLFMTNISGSPWPRNQSVSFVTRRTSIEDVGSVSKRSVTVRDDRMVFLDSAEGLANISVDDRISVPRRTRPRRPPSSNYTGSPMQIYRDDNGELKYKYGTSNETNTKKPDTSTATRDKIYFPEENRFDHTPVPAIEKPDCAKDSTFCLEDQNYPESHIESLLEKNYKQYVDFLTEDYITADLTQRNDIPGEESLCESYENKVYPKSAENRDHKWLYIINQSNFTQGVRVEQCRRESQPCSLASLFPPTYISECRQKYQYRQLLALDERGEIIKDFFRLPSCCKCYVRQG
ncbi:protein spaetzle isoform X2 [Phlebotomus papatasi]|uniref:protein spaetzle isoform X2 n=1 Tax=Phlebotomus papatasi TaxID=29031 RepID=UPI00248420A0|nr:protein spaetzle isoform X2 [Phlebotomus papatasi]